MTLRTLSEYLSSEMALHGGKRPVKIVLSPEAAHEISDGHLTPRDQAVTNYSAARFYGVPMEVDENAELPVRAVFEEE